MLHYLLFAASPPSCSSYEHIAQRSLSRNGTAIWFTDPSSQKCFFIIKGDPSARLWTQYRNIRGDATIQQFSSPMYIPRAILKTLLSRTTLKIHTRTLEFYTLGTVSTLSCCMHTLAQHAATTIPHLKSFTDIDDFNESFDCLAADSPISHAASSDSIASDSMQAVSLDSPVTGPPIVHGTLAPNIFYPYLYEANRVYFFNEEGCAIGSYEYEGHCGGFYLSDEKAIIPHCWTKNNQCNMCRVKGALWLIDSKNQNLVTLFPCGQRPPGLSEQRWLENFGKGVVAMTLGRLQT